MASPTKDPLPIDWEQRLIGAYFDSTILLVFLTGVYTVIFLGTLYSYLNRKNETNKVIISTITALYMVSFGQLCVQWYAMLLPFINYSSTRVSILYELYGVGTLTFGKISGTVLAYIGCLLADGLLVWRCIKLHGHWSRILIIPILLFAAEIALTIVATALMILTYTAGEYEWLHRARQYDVVNGALSITVAVTSLIVTLLICYRIHISTKDVLRRTNRHKYKSMIRILVDSSMIYSLAVVGCSIISLLGPSKLSTWLAVAVEVGGQFVSAFVDIVLGLAPTLMVARITTNNDKERDDMSSIKLPSDLLSVPTQSMATIHNSGDNTLGIRCRVSIGV